MTSANSSSDAFLSIVKESRSILITSHISPDPDAVSSLLLMGKTISLNFSDKKMQMVLENEPIDLDFLNGYDEILFEPILTTVERYRPDLLIMLDGNSYERFSRHDGEKLRAYVSNNTVKTIIIDHHELTGSDNVDLYINDRLPATAQAVYDICFSQLGLKKPEDYAETTMVGLYGDTGGFVYMMDGNHKKVFGLVESLVDAGVDIEQVKTKLSQFQDEDMKILGELINHVNHEDEYTYSYLSDETIDTWDRDGKSQMQLQRATGAFLDEYVRNIGGRKWGFIVYKNTLQGDNYYSASFRSLSGVKDVSVIANVLGGGGHKPAAGAKFEAAGIEDALSKVKKAIAE